MTVRVKLFAMLKDAAGVGECRLTLAPHANGLDAREALVAQHPRLRDVIPVARLALNHEYRSWETPLGEGDELALVMPVSGG